MELKLNQIRFDDDDASILPLTSLCSALHVTDYDDDQRLGGNPTGK